MCGIAGILSVNSTPVDAHELKSLADALAHRGPDGEGLWIDAQGKVGLAHRRLAIIDTSRLGDQPMHSADGRYTIVFNGEIYNFLELRDELAREGCTFASDSDTEVILAAWSRWGEAMLPRFNGMWALALHDRDSGEVFLARDRFGIKPLLYAPVGDRLAFASEMRALRRLPWVPQALDEEVVRRQLFDPFGVEGSERTTNSAIRRLPAGHCARWRDGTLAVRRWWRTVDHLVDVPAKAAEQAERFHELFVDAVRLRMRSDVTVGTCLSGGFDSSAIVCTMAEVASGVLAHRREATDWRHAFIASFPGQVHDETQQALEVADWAKVTAHTFDLSHRDDVASIDRVLRDLDELYIGLPAAPWHIYARLRQQGTVVSLDGHGADELMGGYLQQGQGMGFFLRNGVSRLMQSSPVAAAALDHAKAAWLRRRGLNYLRGRALPAALRLPADDDELPDRWGALNRRLYRMFHCSVLPTILRNFDRLSMAHGIEVRMPFMDWRLVTYVMSLPDSAKFAGGLSKVVARDAMTGHMPEGIRASARKVGFNSPMPEWLNTTLGSWVDDLLRRPDPLFEHLVDAHALHRRTAELHATRGWNWESAGRLWPYLHLKWMLAQEGSAS